MRSEGSSRGRARERFCSRCDTARRRAAFPSPRVNGERGKGCGAVLATQVLAIGFRSCKLLTPLSRRATLSQVLYVCADSARHPLPDFAGRGRARPRPASAKPLTTHNSQLTTGRAGVDSPTIDLLDHFGVRRHRRDARFAPFCEIVEHPVARVRPVQSEQRVRLRRGAAVAIENARVAEAAK